MLFFCDIITMLGGSSMLDILVNFGNLFLYLFEVYVIFWIVGGFTAMFLMIPMLFIAKLYTFSKMTFKEKKVKISLKDFVILIVYIVIILFLGSGIFRAYSKSEIQTEVTMVLLMTIGVSFYLEKSAHCYKELFVEARAKYYLQNSHRLKDDYIISLAETIAFIENENFGYHSEKFYFDCSKYSLECYNLDWMKNIKKTLYTDLVCPERITSFFNLYFMGEEFFLINYVLEEFMNFNTRYPYHNFCGFLFQTNVAYNVYTLDKKNFAYNLIQCLNILVSKEFLSNLAANDLLCEIYFDNYKKFDYENTVVLFNYFDFDYKQLLELYSEYKDDSDEFYTMLLMNLNNYRYNEKKYENLNFEKLLNYEELETKQNIMKVISKRTSKKIKNEFIKNWAEILTILEKNRKIMEDEVCALKNANIVWINDDKFIMTVGKEWDKLRIRKIKPEVINLLKKCTGTEYSFLVMLVEEWKNEL